MSIPILKLHQVLISPLRGDLTDSDWEAFRREILQSVGQHGSLGVVLDVSTVEVLDSYATRTLQAIAAMLQLRGARTVITGIRPHVAFTMVHLGLDLEDTPTAPDLETGLDLIHRLLREGDDG